MTKKETILYTFIFLFIVFTHLVLIQLNVLKGALSMAILIDVVLSILIFSSVIMLRNNDKNKETFAQRYLIVTTIQFIGFLSVILALVYSGIPDVKYWSFTALIIFLMMLITQTVLLLRSLNANSGEQSNKESN